MTGPKHTPGPWRVEQDTNLIWGACNPDDTSARGMGYPIIDAHAPSSWANGRPTQSERDANSQLIAAAPDLLEALQALLATKGKLTAENYLRRPQETREAVAMAHAAIARAEGRS